MAYIYRENLMVALAIAIRERQRQEQTPENPDFESAFLAGIKEVQESLKRGERLEIRD